LKGKTRFMIDKFTWRGSTGNEEQKQVVSVSFKLDGCSIKDLGRPIYWQKEGYPIWLEIGSDMIEQDIEIIPVKSQLSFINEQKVPADQPAGSSVAAAPQAKEESICNTCSGFASCPFEIRKGVVYKCEAYKSVGESRQEPGDEKAEPGTTPIRTGEPIIPAAHLPGDLCKKCAVIGTCDMKDAAEFCSAFKEIQPKTESDQAFDKLESMTDNGDGNGHIPVVVLDIENLLKVKVLDDNKGYDVSLDGCRKKSKDDLVGTIIYVFNEKGVVCKTADDLIDILLEYPTGEKRNMLIDILKGTKVPQEIK
jgi:hypothetical protein